MASAQLNGPFDEEDRESSAGDGSQGEAFDDDDAVDADAGSEPPGEEQLREEADEARFEDELPLAEDEARLPWLEGDEEEEEYGGYTRGQTFALIAAVVIVLGLVAGGIWWLSRSEPDADLVADGSTIRSDGPYKERPDDPGGKVFEGTGDASFKLSEGQPSPVRLGQASSQPAPGFQTLEPRDKLASGAALARQEENPVQAAQELRGLVQVGAYSSRALAEEGWNRLARQHAELQQLRHRIEEGKADIGTVYRLQALTSDNASAEALCRRLKAAGANCMVKSVP